MCAFCFVLACRCTLPFTYREWACKSWMTLLKVTQNKAGLCCAEGINNNRLQTRTEKRWEIQKSDWDQIHGFVISHCRCKQIKQGTVWEASTDLSLWDNTSISLLFYTLQLPQLSCVSPDQGLVPTQVYDTGVVALDLGWKAEVEGTGLWQVARNMRHRRLLRKPV